MVNFIEINKKLQAIVSKKSREIAQREFERVRGRFLDALKYWKTEVRMLLSVPYMKGVPNTSKFPRLREGGLRKSLSYRTTTVHKMNSNKFKLTARIMWDDDPSRFTRKGPTGVDYGTILNESNRFKNATFFGWRDRSQDLLRKRIREAIL